MPAPMLVQRYLAVRSRLIELFKILEYQEFQVWIAPKTMMTTDELRNRDTQWKEGYANDVHYYDTQTLRSMRIPMLLRHLDRFVSHRDLGWKNPNTNVVLVYESIQEYLSLWCEIINENRFPYPPMAEFRDLERLAYLIFPDYKMIKPYRRNQILEERIKNDQMLNAKGLAGMGALFGMYRLGTQGEEEISFISHLDGLQRLDSYGLSLPTLRAASMGGDSLSVVEVERGNPNWVL